MSSTLWQVVASSSVRENRKRHLHKKWCRDKRITQANKMTAASCKFNGVQSYSTKCFPARTSLHGRQEGGLSLISAKLNIGLARVVLSCYEHRKRAAINNYIYILTISLLISLLDLLIYPLNIKIKKLYINVNV